MRAAVVLRHYALARVPLAFRPVRRAIPSMYALRGTLLAIGANGWSSSNDTFKADAGTVCEN
jgi:hypothetical protein